MWDEFAHDGELKDGFAEFGDVFFDGVEFAEVLGDELPGLGEGVCVWGGEEAIARCFMDGDFEAIALCPEFF